MLSFSIVLTYFNTLAMNDITKRFFEELDKNGITAYRLAKEIDGISQQKLSHARTGKNEISLSIVSAVCKQYRNIDYRYIMSGERENSNIPDIAPDLQMGIPLVPVSAIGGALTGMDGQYMEYEAERYIVPAFHKSDFLIRVDGDSMEPTYCRGDIVACTRVPLNDIWFQWGKVYVCDTRQGALIKHIEPGSDKDHIMLVSDNEKYKPFELHKSELNGVAIVNGLIRVE